MNNIYTTVKIIIDNETYIGAAIGFEDELEKTERAAIKNLLEKLKEIDKYDRR